jgi:hypothetical protein
MQWVFHQCFYGYCLKLKKTDETVFFAIYTYEFLSKDLSSSLPFMNKQ